MSVIVSCPKCQKKLKIEDNVLGKNIKCPGCAAVFATKAPGAAAAAPPAPVKAAPAAPKKAPPPDDEDEDEAPRRPAKAAPKAARDDDDEEDDRPAKKPAAKAARDDDDEDEDRPTKKPAAKKSRADDDEDEDDRPAKGAAKRRRPADDDDEDDDRPAKKEKKKGGAGKVLAIIGVIVLLLCGGCGGLGYYFVYKAKELGNDFVGAITDAQEKMKTAPEFQHPSARQGGPVLPGGDTKKPDGGRGAAPDGGQPAKADVNVSAEALAKDLLTDNRTMSTKYGNGLLLVEVEGTVAEVTPRPDGTVQTIVFKPEVMEGPRRGGTKRVVPVWCNFSPLLTASQAANVAVGKKVKVRGKVTGWDPNGKQATLSDCTLP